MMSDNNKLILIHWNRAEAEALALKFERAGWQVDIEAEDGGRAYQKMKTEPTAVMVIYLTRLPSHGRETAHAVRSLKATRHIPIIFVGGQGEALEKTKGKIPDAVYTTETEVLAALNHYLNLSKEDMVREGSAH